MARYKNDVTGAPAYDPAILLKIVLFAYSKGITHSHKIEALCRENVVFMALSADAQPHFTTIADFISSSTDEVVRIFRDVLLVCDEAGLISREMFAIDGLKLPSNASKEWSGKREELQKKAQKIQRAMEHLLEKHRSSDESDDDTSMRASEAQQLQPCSTRCRRSRISWRLIKRRSAAQARRFKATSPITSRRRCPRARAWCRAIPAWQSPTASIK